jgi:hypothetical protein
VLRYRDRRGAGTFKSLPVVGIFEALECRSSSKVCETKLVSNAVDLVNIEGSMRHVTKVCATFTGSFANILYDR